MTRPGASAEDAAARFLENQGLKVLERNYRCRFGEIDLVAKDGKILVFVEVRFRSGTSFGGAIESITPAKRGKLLKAARHYMAAHNAFPACRIDAVLLIGDTDHIEWIRDAFGE
jgi:putative endonuclease